MNTRSEALDILIEDLALQLLSARAAAAQTETLHTRVAGMLERLPRSRNPQRMHHQRILTKARGNTGEKLQQARTLVSVLEWDLRLYWDEREAAGGSRKAKTGAGRPRARARRRAS